MTVTLRMARVQGGAGRAGRAGGRPGRGAGQEAWSRRRAGGLVARPGGRRSRGRAAGLAGREARPERWATLTHLLPYVWYDRFGFRGNSGLGGILGAGSGAFLSARSRSSAVTRTASAGRRAPATRRRPAARHLAAAGRPPRDPRARLAPARPAGRHPARLAPGGRGQVARCGAISTGGGPGGGATLRSGRSASR